MNETCTFLRAGDLGAIIGDDTPRGGGAPQYSGIWSLYHGACQASPFQNNMAGLISSAHRGSRPTLEKLDESTARLVKPPCELMPHATTTGTYRLRPPHYVDYRFDACFSPDAKNIPREIELIWASYMNSPGDSSIYFLEKNAWTKMTPDIHGMNATVLPCGLDAAHYQGWEKRDGEDRFREQGMFWQSLSGHTFDYPFYFGLAHNMVFLLMADCHRDFRIFLSPRGANYSCLPGQTSPAWDFTWVVWDALPGQTRTLNVRLAWFRAPAWDLTKQVWLEWEKFREEFPSRDDSN